MKYCVDCNVFLWQIKEQHASELKGLERRLSEARAACGAAEETAKECEERAASLRQAHSQSLRLLEKSVGEALGTAVASARQRSGGGGGGGEAA